MGCWPIVGDATWGAQDEADSVAAIEAALEAGINFFDTAESYGNGYSEELLGRVLSPRRGEVVIASKVSPANMRPDDLKAACERSLKRLRTDYIDLYQLHWPNWEIPYEHSLEALQELKAEGKVRAIGCSNFGPADLADLLRCGRVESNQLAYNMLWRGIEFDLQPLCVENDVSILAYCPLAQGLLTGKFRSADEVPEGRARTRHFSGKRPQARHGEPGKEKETFAAIERVRRLSEKIGAPMADVALAWLLSRPGVVSVLAGARNAQQIRENAKAADVKLSKDALRRLTRATDELKNAFGPALDMWQHESRIR
jgi:myo-inositol catabolism protein IolS